MEKEVQALSPAQLGTFAEVTVGDGDGQCTLSLDFILWTWMKGKDLDSAAPLLTALDLVEKYRPPSFTSTLHDIMPSSHPGPAAAAMADFVLSHHDQWPGDVHDFGATCLLSVLLNSDLDPERRRLVEALPRDLPPLPR